MCPGQPHRQPYAGATAPKPALDPRTFSSFQDDSQQTLTNQPYGSSSTHEQTDINPYTGLPNITLNTPHDQTYGSPRPYRNIAPYYPQTQDDHQSYHSQQHSTYPDPSQSNMTSNAHHFSGVRVFRLF